MLCSSGWLKLGILLAHSPKYRDCRCAPPMPDYQDITFSIKVHPSMIVREIRVCEPLTLVLLETAAVFAPKLVDLIAAAVSVKTGQLLDFLVMTVFSDLTLVLTE